MSELQKASKGALNLFVPITKIDIEKRLVYGVAADETPDKADEVFDYSTSKPLFEKWSGEIEKNTDGKSKGNIRSMHSTVAAGKVQDIQFDDNEKSIPICAKVVDENEWEKVKEGVYTGFSIGGKYVKRWLDTTLGKTRYTASPTEISLVDLPCNPSATFSMVKADGVIEQVNFKIKESDEELNKNENSIEKTIVKVFEINKDILSGFQKAFAVNDLAKAFSYEEIRDRVRGAINEKIHTPFNCGYFWVMNTYPDKVVIQGDLDGDNDEDLYEVPYTIDDQGVVSINTAGIKQVKVEYVPTVDESDGSATVKSEETGELQKSEPDLTLKVKLEVDKVEVEKTIENLDLAKAGAVHSKATVEKLQKMHHDIGDMGGACKCDKCQKLYASDEAEKAVNPEGLTKASNPGNPESIEKVEQSNELQKMAERFGSLEKVCKDLVEKNESLSAELQKIKDQPMPGGPVSNTGSLPVNKSLGGTPPEPTQNEREIAKAVLQKAIETTTDQRVKEALSKELAMYSMGETLQNPILITGQRR